MIYPDFSEAWVSQLDSVVAAGEHKTPRGLPTRERAWVQFSVDDPLSFPVAAEGRKFRDVIGVLEGLSLVGQVSIPETFTDRVSKFADFTDAGVFHGAYGARVHGRLGDLVELLGRDPDTRQAVLSIYDSRSDLGPSKRDIPCTLSLHFLRVRGLLEMRVTMRSNDMWLGTPYDFTQFAILQASVAQAVHEEPGTYVHTSGSLHVYERDLEAIGKVKGPEIHAPFPFPLWSIDPELGTPEMRIAEIGRRARRILLGQGNQLEGSTEFETWARHQLVGG